MPPAPIGSTISYGPNLVPRCINAIVLRCEKGYAGRTSAARGLPCFARQPLSDAIFGARLRRVREHGSPVCCDACSSRCDQIAAGVHEMRLFLRYAIGVMPVCREKKRATWASI